MAKSLNLTDKEKETYFKPVQAYFNKLSVLEKAFFNFDYWSRNKRQAYYQNLRYLLMPEEFGKSHAYIKKNKIGLEKYPKRGKVDYEKMDTVWNVLKTFKHNESVEPINKNENYRYKELRAFIRLCRDLNIQATFVVGPYNERFMQSQPQNLEDYKNVTINVKALLEAENASFIDATDISGTAGAFKDYQHHSSYGAYLIYNKIKNYLYERNGN